MENFKNAVDLPFVGEILQAFGFGGNITELKRCIENVYDGGNFKFVISATVDSGERVIVKIFNEYSDPDAEQRRIENESIYSELLRSRGIITPRRYTSGGSYAIRRSLCGVPCIVSVEDWCGEEITAITSEIARDIGALLGRIHLIGLDTGFVIGNMTLLCAAGENDVDAYSEFCEITENENLDSAVVSEIKHIRDGKMAHLREIWDTLPRAATQGDISICNLSKTEKGLAVFDYNHAGDDVLVSDLVLEGLLTANEMDLPPNETEEYRKALFPAFLEGYLSVRRLSEAESNAAWEIYTIYNTIWFSKIICFSNTAHGESSLMSLVEAGKYDAANILIKEMLVGITAKNDGRFG